MPRPRGDDWLDDELSVLREDHGVDVLVCLQTASEREEQGLTDEPAAAARAGLEFHDFPIGDRRIPDGSRPSDCWTSWPRGTERDSTSRSIAGTA